MEVGRKGAHGFSRKLSLPLNFPPPVSFLLYLDAADPQRKPGTVKRSTEVGTGIYELDTEQL